jgi:hypothetical protein
MEGVLCHNDNRDDGFSYCAFHPDGKRHDGDANCWRSRKTISEPDIWNPFIRKPIVCVDDGGTTMLPFAWSASQLVPDPAFLG